MKKVDHAFDEGRRKNTNATEIQQIDAEIRAHAVIAEMRVAMNDAKTVEGRVYL